MSFRPNTLVKEDEVGTSASSTSQPNFGLKRLNRWIMPIVRGLPVVNASTTPVSTTLGSPGLSMVQTYRYKYQFVLDCTSSFTGANSLTQPVASSQKMINAGSGAYDIVDGNVV